MESQSRIPKRWCVTLLTKIAAKEVTDQEKNALDLLDISFVSGLFWPRLEKFPHSPSTRICLIRMQRASGFFSPMRRGYV
jgi:hypothetical protein